MYIKKIHHQVEVVNPVFQREQKIIHLLSLGLCRSHFDKSGMCMKFMIKGFAKLENNYFILFYFIFYYFIENILEHGYACLPASFSMKCIIKFPTTN